MFELAIYLTYQLGDPQGVIKKISHKPDRKHRGDVALGMGPRNIEYALLAVAINQNYKHYCFHILV